MGRRVVLLGIFVIAVLVALWLVGDAMDAPGPGGTRSDDGPGRRPVVTEDAPGTAGAREGRISVKGFVFHAETNLAVPGARVEFTEEGGETLTTSTNARGEWTLSLPERPEGYARILVTARGYAPSDASPVGRFDDRIRRYGHVVFLYPALTMVRGRVVDHADRPVAGAEVTDDFDLVRVRTDAAGRFPPIAVSRWMQTLVVMAEGQARWWEQVTLPPEPPEAMEVEIVLPAPHLATGIVVDDLGHPLAGVRVEEYEYQVNRSVRTDRSGRFTWPIPRHGTDWVTVFHPGHREQYEYGGLIHGRGGIRIVMDRTASVEGRVVVPDGALVPPEFRVRTDHGHFPVGTDGEFVIDDLPPGQCRLRVGELVTGVSWRYKGGWVDYGFAPKFRLAPGERRSGTVIEIPPPGRMCGRVIDAGTGHPVPGARVEHAVANDEGRYVLPQPASATRRERTGEVLAPGYLAYRGVLGEEIRLVPARTVVVHLRKSDGSPVAGSRISPALEHFSAPDGPVVTDVTGRAECVAAAPGPSVLRLGSGERFTVPPGVHEITWVRKETAPLVTLLVTDESGNPLPGARFFQNPGDNFELGGGRLGLRSRRISLPVTAPGYEVIRDDYLERDPSDSITLRLRRSVPVRGRVVDSEGRPVPAVDVDTPAGSFPTDGRGRFVIHGFVIGEPFTAELDVEGWPTVKTEVVAGSEEVEIRLPTRATVRIRFPEDRAGGAPVWEVFRGSYQEMDSFLGSHTEDEVERFSRREKGAVALDLPDGPVGIWFRVPPGAARYFRNVRAPCTLAYDFPQFLRVTGCITGPDGKPVGGADLSIAETGRFLGETDAGGRYEIAPDGFDLVDREAAAGPWRLLVEHEETCPLLTEPVDLATGGEYDFRLSRGGTLKGRITGVGAVTGLEFTADGFHWPGFDGPEKDGTFACDERIRPGRHRLEIFRQDAPVLVREFTIRDGEETFLRIEGP